MTFSTRGLARAATAGIAAFALLGAAACGGGSGQDSPEDLGKAMAAAINDLDVDKMNELSCEGIEVTQEDIDEMQAEGFSVEAEFVDFASGQRNGRPEYQRMFEAARKRRFDVLLVCRYDRFARSMQELVIGHVIKVQGDSVDVQISSENLEVEYSGKLHRIGRIVCGNQGDDAVRYRRARRQLRAGAAEPRLLRPRLARAGI